MCVWVCVCMLGATVYITYTYLYFHSQNCSDHNLLVCFAPHVPNHHRVTWTAWWTTEERSGSAWPTTAKKASGCGWTGPGWPHRKGPHLKHITGVLAMVLKHALHLHLGHLVDALIRNHLQYKKKYYNTKMSVQGDVHGTKCQALVIGRLSHSVFWCYSKGDQTPPDSFTFKECYDSSFSKCFQR